MKTIFIILITLPLGVIFGLILGRVVYGISNLFLKNNVSKAILNDTKMNFSYKDKPYSLKEEINFERRKRKPFSLFGIFKKKQVKGGISDYGNTLQPADSGKPVLAIDTGIKQADVTESRTTSPEPTSASPNEYKRNDSPEARGSQGRTFNRNLFEKGKKLY